MWFKQNDEHDKIWYIFTFINKGQFFSVCVCVFMSSNGIANTIVDK